MTRADPIAISWTLLAVVGVGLSGYGLYVSHFVLERAAGMLGERDPRRVVAKASCRRELIRFAISVLFTIAGFLAMAPVHPWTRTAIVSCLLAAAALIDLKSIIDQLYRLRMFRYFERHPESPPVEAR